MKTVMKREEIFNVLKEAEDGGNYFFPSGERSILWNTLPGFAAMLEEIKQEAERFLGQPIMEIKWSTFRIFSETGSRREYEVEYFEKRKRLNTFAIMVLLEQGEQKYVTELCDIIWSICNEYTWCLPAHFRKKEQPANSIINENWLNREDALQVDLFAAETGFALSEVAHLTEAYLPKQIRQRIQHEVYRRIFYPYVHLGPHTWETTKNNWAAVCAGSIGSAALYFIEDPNELALVLEKVLRTISCFLEGYADDGACTEGYGYWSYGFGFFVYFADLLKKRTAGRIDLFDDEKVHQIALFPQKCFMSGHHVVNFSDASPKAEVFLGLSHYMHRVFPDVIVPEVRLRSAYTADHCGRWASAIRNLLWFDPELVGQPWGNADYYLPDAQWLISRHVTENGICCFATKGGHNAEPHNHNDIGQFILHASGETYLADLGCGLYSAKYFGKERYTIICNSSQGHAVPIINGEHQKQGTDSRAEVRHMELTNDVDRLELEFSSAYRLPGLKELIRSFTWEKTGAPTLHLLDTYTFSEKPDSLVERFIATVLPRTDGNDRLILERSRRLSLQFDPGLVEPVVSEIDFTNHFGVSERYYAVDFVLKKVDQHAVKLSFSLQFIE